MRLYTGDLAWADIRILYEHVAVADTILEFGAGASTQVLAQTAARHARMWTVETAPEWVVRTKDNLRRLSISRDVEFLSFEMFRNYRFPPLDLVFNDGVESLRLEFARIAWKALKPGGRLLFHDTRRPRDVRNVLQLIEPSYTEVERLLCNVSGSNITLIVKKLDEPYVNWHHIEDSPGQSQLDETQKRRVY